MADAKKMGMKIVEQDWTMEAYDGVVITEAPNDETMDEFILKLGSLGNVKAPTLRAFRRSEIESDSGEDKYALQSPNFAISAGDKVVGRR